MFSHTKLKVCPTNPNDNIKNRCRSKIVLGHACFQLWSESTFSLNVFCT